MTSTRPWMNMALVAVLAAVAASIAFVVFDSGDENAAPVDLPTEVNDEATVASFLTAWERFRLGVFVITSEFTRTLDDGSVLTAPRGLAQSPPVRVTSEFANASTSYVDGEVACTTDELGFFSCLEAGLDMEAYRAELQAEQIVLASYLSDSPPLYVIDQLDDGCFEFLIAQVMALPPYGSRALFCFDDATGALERQLVVRESATDEVRAIEIRTDVTAEDLRIDTE